MMQIPRATYRLQFREGMDFDRAAALAPYLARLGISHLYASPIFAAPAGSTHGYDVADHNAIDPSLGGRAGFDRLSAALKREGLGLLLDIVPNHMAASLENPWWRSVVEWGVESPFARHFDIDWRERLTLPILGKSFEEAAAGGEITLAADPEAGTLALRYFDQHLPIMPSTCAEALADISGALADGVRDAAARADPASEAMHETLRRLLTDGATQRELQAALEDRSRQPGFLGRLHERQPWRLLFWKEARRHLSYRRFFEVTGLAGVRVEDEGVFADVHGLTLELVRAGQVQGLRIDHVDGLADPKGYLVRLREAAGPEVFIVVEKILGEGEALPFDWPVEGTTGYEFAAAMPELFVDASGAAKLSAHFDALRGAAFDMAEERRAAKTRMVEENFETELKGLARLAAALTGLDAAALREGIAALIVAFPFYRTYGDVAGMSAGDRALLADAAEKAKARLGEAGATALDAVTGLLLAPRSRIGAVAASPPSVLPANVMPGGEGEALSFRARFQQLTGPATAKSVEDTLFYRANQLIGLNEVGGDPAQGVGSVARFHAAMAEHAKRQPHGLLATATHDTKRGEDARARLYALSEAPERWAAAVARWRGMNAEWVRTMPGGPAPEPETEWLLYQALAGAWPMAPGVPDAATLAGLSERFGRYVEKAMREAKLRTGWSDPDEAYEAAVKAYAAHLLDPANAAFLADFAAVLEPLAAAGRRNGLCQTLVKLTAPGVPDIYQGTEGWDLSLVDPDNRRPVDFDGLDAQLEKLEGGAAAGDDPKLRLIGAGLKLRREHETLFARGSYRPVEVTGLASGRIVAFLREHEGEAVMTVVSRFGLERGADWGDAALSVAPGSRWECMETGHGFDAEGGILRIVEVLREGPCALLRRAA